MRSREVSEASGAKVRLPADPWSNDECPPVHDHRGSGHLSYYQALEQGFQGCLETTRADLGSGPLVCWVRQTGYVTAEPAPARRSSPRPTQPNQRRYEALRAYFVEPISVEARGGAESAAWKSALGGPGAAMRRGYPTDTDKRCETIKHGGSTTESTPPPTIAGNPASAA